MHRDLSFSSNLFLCHRNLEQVKLLDFGIARRAPDVAPDDPDRRGDRHAGVHVSGAGPRSASTSARVPIFCPGLRALSVLSASRPLLLEHLAAVLAKILFEEPPSQQSAAARAFHPPCPSL